MSPGSVTRYCARRCAFTTLEMPRVRRPARARDHRQVAFSNVTMCFPNIANTIADSNSHMVTRIGEPMIR